MSNHLHYINCPVCDSADFKNAFSVKDHTVSGEMFSIVECNSCSLRFTQDVPDADSISPYYKSEDYISHTDESKGMIGKLYKKVRNTTLAKKRKLIQKEAGIINGNLLDIGSGTGAFVNEMNLHGWNATGIEPDEGARNVANKLYNIELQDEKEFYSLPKNSFDVITLWHVLEHLHYLSEYIERMKELLKKSARPDDPVGRGKIFIAVPNYTSFDAKIYKEYWAAYDVPRHLYHFSPMAMGKLMEKHGLKIVSHKPMWYDSFYVSLLSSKYKYARPDDPVGRGKTKWLSALWYGFRSNMNAMNDVKKCSSVIYIVSPHTP